MYIAAVVRENGHWVKMVDLGVEPHALTQDLMKWADTIGISADSPSYPEALSIAALAKRNGKTVVMGGYHVTFMDHEALDTGWVDFVVRGEGEQTFLNLVNTLESKGDLAKVPGISYLQYGIYFKNPDAQPPVDLDNLPFPARDLVPMKKYNSIMNGWNFTNLITSRGCPYNCYFCSSSRFGGLKWRSRSAKSIVDEIEFLVHNFGYRAFSFMDDNFTLIPKRVFEFADELERRGLNYIRWWCFSRVDILVKNEEMIRRMAEVGAYMIFLGLESPNESILESYNKHIGNDQQQKAIELLKKYGIEIHASYIIGDVKETVEMAEKTINWAMKLKAKTSQFSILTPYPGTALFEDVRKENRFLHKRWDIYDGLHPVIKLDYIMPKELVTLLVKAYKKVYLNPKYLFQLIFGGKKSRRDKPSRTLGERIMNVVKTIAVIGLLVFRFKKYSTTYVTERM
jgi:anaerobic magnesium-protoporphyrin IX monomethyl ester cyclase